MVKSVDRGAAIRDIELLEKSGGKSGEWQRRAHEPRDSTPARPVRRAAGRIRRARNER
jgi:hypothetical protein